MDALVERAARDLTITGNDTARPGVGVGKLIDAGCAQELRPPATVMLETRVERDGELIADGLAEVLAPATRQVIDADSLPEPTVQRDRHVGRLLGPARRCRRCRRPWSPPSRRVR
jgi:hypothetical protein